MTADQHCGHWVVAHISLVSATVSCKLLWLCLTPAYSGRSTCLAGWVPPLEHFHCRITEVERHSTPLDSILSPLRSHSWLYAETGQENILVKTTPLHHTQLLQIKLQINMICLTSQCHNVIFINQYWQKIYFSYCRNKGFKCWDNEVSKTIATCCLRPELVYPQERTVRHIGENIF